MITPLYDINNVELNVGDVVYRSIYSIFEKTQILKINEKSVTISVEREVHIRSWGKPVTIYNQERFLNHNSYISLKRGITYNGRHYPEFLLCEKNVPLSDKLKNVFIKNQ